jgi:hypothetical protein
MSDVFTEMSVANSEDERLVVGTSKLGPGDSDRMTRAESIRASFKALKGQDDLKGRPPTRAQMRLLERVKDAHVAHYAPLEWVEPRGGGGSDYEPGQEWESDFNLATARGLFRRRLVGKELGSIARSVSIYLTPEGAAALSMSDVDCAGCVPWEDSYDVCL